MRETKVFGQVAMRRLENGEMDLAQSLCVTEYGDAKEALADAKRRWPVKDGYKGHHVYGVGIRFDGEVIQIDDLGAHGATRFTA